MYQTGRFVAPLASPKSTAFCTRSAQLLVARSAQRARLLRAPARGSAPRATGGGGLGLLARQRAGGETDARDAEPRGDLGRAVPELERPDRVGRAHVERAVAGDARRPRVARDRRPDRLGPARDEVGEAGLRAEARELGANVIRQPVQGSPPRPAPARPAARCAGSR